MTNAHPYLTTEQEQQLLDIYRVLSDLARTCQVPTVSAAVRAALAPLHTALDGQDLDHDHYRHPDDTLAS
ncbi:DUF6052 family protein [Streptomyces sp. NPDC056061]|uniref:DUF6052 family protein n=1 Tax=Streptomyces sp. NPDC056061 TaxID=3345700 RepID=UPI0035DEA43B